MYPLIDIHTHRKEPDAAALRSIRLGTDAVPSDGSLFSAGIHPWDSEKADPQGLRQLETLPCAAIGEIGLDSHYDFSPRETPQKVFEPQIQLALELDMPLIVHDREAHADTMSLLKKYRPKGIFHCYSGSAEMAKDGLL